MFAHIVYGHLVFAVVFWADPTPAGAQTLRDLYLSPPLDVVGIEQIFSHATSIIQQKCRNRLLTLTVSHLLLLQEFYRRDEQFCVHIPVVDNMSDFSVEVDKTCPDYATVRRL